MMWDKTWKRIGVTGLLTRTAVKMNLFRKGNACVDDSHSQ